MIDIKQLVKKYWWAILLFVVLLFKPQLQSTASGTELQITQENLIPMLILLFIISLISLVIRYTILKWIFGDKWGKRIFWFLLIGGILLGVLGVFAQLGDFYSGVIS